MATGLTIRIQLTFEIREELLFFLRQYQFQGQDFSDLLSQLEIDKNLNQYITDREIADLLLIIQIELKHNRDLSNERRKTITDLLDILRKAETEIKRIYKPSVSIV